MKKVYIYTLGCKSNQYEAKKIMEDFYNFGLTEAENIGNADIIIINSCCITNTAQAKSRKYARRAAREKENATIVLTGCFATIISEKLDFIDLIIPHKDKMKTATLVMNFLGLEMKKNDNPISIKNKTRTILKIQDGCNRRCTYCIIPDIRGNETSFSLDSIISETKKFVKQGFKEIVVSGMVTGNWKNKDLKFIDLLKELVKIKEFRLRISSLDVRDINDDLIKFILKTDKICNHLHIPLQSGSEEILNKMNRRYSPDKFKSIVKLAEEIDPLISITTDVICGFPGETEDNFMDTFNLLNELPIFDIHIFPFSVRPGTPAEKFKPVVAENIKKNRVNKLIELKNKKRLIYFEKNINKKVKVLIEKSGKLWSKGFSENYIEVKINETLEPDNFYNVKLIEFDENGMVGMISK